MRYEYKNLKIAKDVIFKSKNDPTINVGNPAEFEKALNELGADGWELIQMIDPKGFMGLGDVGYCIFKRQVKYKWNKSAMFFLHDCVSCDII